MNWVGGSRARAKARQRLFNARCAINERNNQANGHEGEELQELPMGEVQDIYNEENPRRASCNNGGRNSLRQDSEDPITRRGNHDGNGEENDAVPGRQLLRAPIQRRVVPLLEFTKRKIPRGNIICLILDHQIDITRVPPPPQRRQIIMGTPSTVQRQGSASSSSPSRYRLPRDSTTSTSASSNPSS